MILAAKVSQSSKYRAALLSILYLRLSLYVVIILSLAEREALSITWNSCQHMGAARDSTTLMSLGRVSNTRKPHAHSPFPPNLRCLSMLPREALPDGTPPEYRGYVEL